MKSLASFINKVDPVIVSFAIFNVIFHIGFAGNLEYHRDELLYFSLGLHPDFGYMSVPPLIGWISWLMQNVFGYSVFAVRLFPAFLSGMMIILSAAIVKELGGSRYASILSATGLTISIFFMRSFSLFHPVHIEIFLWTLCIYLITRYINTQRGVFLILFGFAAGISLLNKYLAIILFAGLLLIIPFTKYRSIFRNKMFWFGILTGAIVFLPNFAWQAFKDFPVFNHMGELYETQLVYMDIPLFLTEQLIMPFTGTLFTVTGLIYLLAGKRIARFRFLGYLALFVIISLMLLKGKSYYTLGIFPLLIISGAVFWSNILKSKLLRIIFPVLLILITLPVVPIGIPVLKQENLKSYFRELDQKYGVDIGRRFEDGSIHSLPQDYADMLGWEELTRIADSAYKMIGDRKAAFIYCENYGQAGAITVIGRKYGLPEPVSFSESFRYWIPLEFDPDITSLVYINDEPGEDIQLLFGEIRKIGSISDPDAREYGTGVWLCQEPADSFNSFWKLRLSELNNE